MKKYLLVLVCLLSVFASFSQFTNTHSQSNPNTLEVWGDKTSDFKLSGMKGYQISAWFPDTSTANNYLLIKNIPNIFIAVGNEEVYKRSYDAKRWILIGGNNCRGTQLISGSITWSGSGLVYDATDLDYYILCSRYFANSTTLTLSVADPTFARIDKFYADITGAIGVITGTPATNPQEPQVNMLNQIDLGFVYIPAGSTVPAGTTQTVIYNENVEWTGTSDVPSINFAYATNPYIGSLSTYLPSAPNSSYVEWQSNGIDYLFSEAQYLKFWVRLNDNFVSEPLSFLDVTFEYTDVTVSQTLAVGNGDFNMDYSLINQWQLVSIPLTGITTYGAAFNEVHFVINSAPSSFQLDYVYLLETATVPPAPVGGTWLLNGNSAINDVTKYIGTRDAKKLNFGTNGQIRAYIDTAGIDLLIDDTTANVILIDSNGKIWKTYQPTILADSPVIIYQDVYQDRIKADTSRRGAALATQYYADSVANAGGGGSTPFGYTLSTTQPTDTSVGWINTNYNILECYPVQYHVNGAWTQVDTVGGQFYDNIGKVFSRGYPYKIIATGQSNLGGSYIGEAADPNASPYNGYYGDTIPARAVAAWNNNQNIWVVAKIRDTPFQYSSGANYLLLAAKKINERTGRSVRIVTYPQGGTGLQCWSGVPGTPPQDSTCYNEFKTRVQNSGVRHPDVFIWAQSEAGITPAPTNTTYFDKWLEMVDSMIARDHLMDTTTLKILMASGDTLTNPNDLYTANNGTSGGEGALRALAATNDRTIKYVDALYFETMLSDGLHFMPKGHEEIATRLFNSIMEGQKNPSRDMMGYGGISAYKFSGNQQKLGATGLTYVNNAGYPYVDLEGTSNSITRYTGATPNASNQYSPGLYFDPINTNTVRLYHFNNTTKVQLEDTRVLTSNIVANTSVEAYSGADPEFVLNDISLNKKWKFQMLNGSNELHFDYDGNDYYHFTKTGELGIGSLPGHVPDSALRVVNGIWGERGVRFSGLSSNQTYSKSLGVTSNGTLYLKDTLAVSGVYLPLTGGTLTGNLLFTDNTYDIGASGATRPRTGYFGTSIVVPTVSLSTTVSGAGTWTAGAINTASNVSGYNGLFGGGVRVGNNTKIYWNSGPVILGNTNDITLKNAAQTAGANVSIGTSAAVASAILDVNSTTKGALLPRMTGSEAEAISSPATGLIIYCTNGNGSVITSVGLWNYNGTAWVTAGAKDYKVLVGNLTQAGTSAPSLTVFQNTTGTTFTMGYNSPGIYSLTANSGTPFTSNKTQVIIGSNINAIGSDVYTMNTSINSTSVIDISSASVSVGFDNGILNNTPIEIRIYP